MLATSDLHRAVAFPTSLAQCVRGVDVLRAFFVALCLLSSSVAFAQTEDLENPGTVSAVQDRAYRLQHELDLSVGVLPLDAFYKGL